MGSEFVQALSGLFNFSDGRLYGFMNRAGGSMILGESAAASVTAGSATTASTATTANATSLFLSQGEWDVQGVVDFAFTTATATQWKVGISDTSATFGGQDTAINSLMSLSTASGTFQKETPVVPVSVDSAGKTMYLVAQTTFSTGAASIYGTINARRAR